jgi:hypothetical protein
VKHVRKIYSPLTWEATPASHAEKRDDTETLSEHGVIQYGEALLQEKSCSLAGLQPEIKACEHIPFWVKRQV